MWPVRPKSKFLLSQHHLWLMPLQQAPEPQRSAWLGSAEGGGGHGCGRPPWAAALSTPAGGPLPETQPFVGLSRLQGRPSERIPVCPHRRALRERSVNPRLSDAGRGRWSTEAIAWGLQGADGPACCPESSGSRAELAAALNATPGPPRSVPLCKPPSIPDVPAR